MKDMSIPNSLVFDLGTANTKVGWSTHGEPESVFPTVVGRGRHKGAMRTLGLKDSYVGRQAQALRGILSLNSPVKQGMIQDWDDLETLWEHVWDKELPRAKHHMSEADAGDYRVLVSVPPLCPPEDWRRMGEILLEGSGVGGIYLANKSVLSMYGGGRTTGVCVDSGEDMTYIVPCWEGSPLPDATLILKLGGKHVTDRLLGLLAQGKYSFPDDTFLLRKRGAKNARRFCVASRKDVVREAKEQFCKVSPSPLVFNDNGILEKAPSKQLNSSTKKRAALAAKDNEEDEDVLRLPDGNIVVVGDESLTAPELLFKPDLIKRQTSGLTDLAQKGRENFTWDGGAHLCSLSSFQRLWLTKQDYMENGATMSIDTGKGFEEKELEVSDGEQPLPAEMPTRVASR